MNISLIICETIKFDRDDSLIFFAILQLLKQFASQMCGLESFRIIHETMNKESDGNKSFHFLHSVIFIRLETSTYMTYLNAI